MLQWRSELLPYFPKTAACPVSDTLIDSSRALLNNGVGRFAITHHKRKGPPKAGRPFLYRQGQWMWMLFFLDQELFAVRVASVLGRV